MKRLILLLLCTSLLAVTEAMAQPRQLDRASWTTYMIKDDGFSVALPELPTKQKERLEKSRRKLILGSSAEGVEYLIYVADNNPRLTLEEFIKDQTTSKPKWNLQSERDLTVSGVSGKSFVYPDKKGMVQFFATENRLYDFRAYGAAVDDARITRYFSSISFGEQKIGLDISDDEKFPAGERTYKGSEVDTKIKLKSKPPPDYTDIAKSKEVRGTVVLKCVFSADGKVTNFEVIAGLPYGLTEKAIEAAKKIKFVPATKDGHNVSMWMLLEYNFNLY